MRYVLCMLSSSRAELFSVVALLYPLVIEIFLRWETGVDPSPSPCSGHRATECRLQHFPRSWAVGHVPAQARGCATSTAQVKHPHSECRRAFILFWPQKRLVELVQVMQELTFPLLCLLSLSQALCASWSGCHVCVTPSEGSTELGINPYLTSALRPPWHAEPSRSCPWQEKGPSCLLSQAGDCSKGNAMKSRGRGNLQVIFGFHSFRKRRGRRGLSAGTLMKSSTFEGNGTASFFGGYISHFLQSLCFLQ